MKKHFLEVLMGCLLLICFYYLSREAAAVAGQMDYSRPVIVVDSGHGGDDPGMIGIGGLKEKGINLSIAKKLREKLEEKNYKVVLTREKDVGLYEESSRNKKAQDMQKRISILQEVKPALCISIHQNSYENPEVKGPQVFYYKDSLEGEKLAAILQKRLNEDLDIQRPRKEKGNTSYYLLKRSPCVLNIVECGFLTNPEEAQLLTQEEYQDKVAGAVADGVQEYLDATLRESN